MKEFNKDKPAKRVSLKFSWYFIVPFALVLLLDQLTKIWIISALPMENGVPVYNLDGFPKPITVIDGFFYIVHITNLGAAWGILAGQKFLLTSIAVITLLGVWLFRKQLGFSHPQMQFAGALFVGGVIGNMIDRLCYGHVVDFLDVHLPLVNYRWPAFNIADCAIATGVGLYMILSLIIEHREKKEMKSGADKAKGYSEEK